MSESSAYKEAGVDIDAAAALVEDIKPHIKKTHRSGVMSGIGGFGALFDLKETGYKDPIMVSGTDGVGTKIKIAIDQDTHDTIGIDGVAMCVNDIVVQGAEPLFFLDYFATGKLENNVAERVIAGVAKGCEIAGCALIGGETAEMPGLYAAGDYDLAGFSVGAVEREDMITGDAITPGDVILGLASSGLHSNGFSLVRHIVKATDGVDYQKEAPFTNGQTLKDFLLEPTRIYVKAILDALKIKDADGKAAIHGMAHITGGGLWENVPRVLPEGCAAVIDCAAWELPPVFQWLKEAGNLKPMDLATTLNTGIGMAVICPAEHRDALISVFESHGEQVFEIGRIQKRDASDQNISFENLDESWG
ncbi:MAG: phosphoribosylformylglycinamidine cyclo-ligase [Alphaproteobacteria bacterium]|nr:phosphoribosylformylglycinamidine cyclo-ligase [Alphaproteobacteria bacterium]